MAPKPIVGFGNPLLDISAHVEQDTLDEWGATLNNAILAEEKHQPLYAKLCEEKAVDYIAGGATLNSIRVAQWLLTANEQPPSTSFIGCIGKDEFGKTMKAQLAKDNVNPLFLESDSTATGTCAVLVKDKERSLIANLAAAEKYNIDHFGLTDVQETVGKAQIFYMAGFPVTHEGGAATVEKVCAHAAAEDKTLCMNLSAPFLLMVPPFRAALLKALESCNYVFCNESEAEELSKQMEWTEKSSEDIAKKISTLTSTRKGGLTAVVTQGSESTVVASNGEVETFGVKANPWTLEASQIIDSNGAGDAFVGGFIYQLSVGGDRAACVRMGHFAAGTIIQQSGCTCPSYDDVKKILA